MSTARGFAWNSSLAIRLNVTIVVGAVFNLLSVATADDVASSPVFTSGASGYAHYRIPAIVSTGDGVLLAFCEGRVKSLSDSGDIDIVLRTSQDGGRTWGPQSVVVSDGDDTCGNPAPIVLRDSGDVVLAFTKNLGTINQGAIQKGEAPPRSVWVTRSADAGATWEVPVEISKDVRKSDWRWYATGPGHGIQLKDGTLVVACDHSTGPDNADMHSHVILSKDGGRTWTLGGIASEKTDESTVCELPDGRLYLNMRNYRGTNRRAVAYSGDGGKSWSPATDDTTLIEPVCQGTVLRLFEDGPFRDSIAFCNPASTKRENLTLRLSKDGGSTWSTTIAVKVGPAAYSDLVEVGPGQIGVLFEGGETAPYEAIHFSVIKMISH
jgi:sialidase-1